MLPLCCRIASELVFDCSGQLYAINMQYGVKGASTNSSANLLVLSLPVSPGATPRPTDFTVQLGQASQTGNVSVLSNFVSDTDFLLRVRLMLTAARIESAQRQPARMESLFTTVSFKKVCWHTLGVKRCEKDSHVLSTSDSSSCQFWCA